MNAKSQLALLGAGFLLSLPVLGQSEWPQWRGPRGDGSVATHSEAKNWPAELTLLWEREIGGGYAGPVAARGSIWVHARQAEEEIVTRLDLHTGEDRWIRQHPVPFEQDEAALKHGRGPYSTPTLVDNRLVTLGVTTILSVWEADTGTLLWRRDFSPEFDPSYTFFGSAASPLVWGGLCFVHPGGSLVPEIGKLEPGAMIALRLEDGSEAWRWTGDGPGLGATPVVYEPGGQPQLIFKTRTQIVGVDPRTGSELWRIPFQVLEDNTITTPLLIGNRLLTSDYDVGVFAWSLIAVGGTSTPRMLWSTREASLSMSSPVVVGDQVVGFSHLHKGQLFGLDPATGRVLWQGEPKWGEHATLISWGGHLLVFREDSSLVVGEVSRDGLQILRRYQLGSTGTWAHPAIVDNLILFRSGKRLATYQLGDQ